MPQTKKAAGPGRASGFAFRIRPGGPAATYSPAPWGAVPWALRGFTAEFGMGSGGAPAPWPPGRRGAPLPWAGEAGRAPSCVLAVLLLVLTGVSAWVDGRMRRGGAPGVALPLGRGRSLGRLGPVGCARRRACTPGLSTWWSTTALMARPGLRVGFPLRCLQRLSRPCLATRLRGWRHDRSTRGTSTPVLSY